MVIDALQLVVMSLFRVVVGLRGRLRTNMASVGSAVCYQFHRPLVFVVLLVRPISMYTPILGRLPHYGPTSAHYPRLGKEQPCEFLGWLRFLPHIVRALLLPYGVVVGLLGVVRPWARS